MSHPRDTVTGLPIKLTKGEATRAAIKAAAVRVFADDGFAQVRVATIMAATGRTPGAFYRHFESKEALLRELLEDFRLELRQQVNQPLRDGEDLLLHLSERTGAFWTVYRRNWGVVTAAFQLAMVDEGFAEIWRAVRRVGIRALSVVIREAQRRGVAAPSDAELTASALCSMLEYTCYNWTAPHADFPNRRIADDQAADILRRIVVRAVLGEDPAPAQPARRSAKVSGR